MYNKGRVYPFLLSSQLAKIPSNQMYQTDIGGIGISEILFCKKILCNNHVLLYILLWWLAKHNKMVNNNLATLEREFNDHSLEIKGIMFNESNKISCVHGGCMVHSLQLFFRQIFKRII